MAVVGEVSSIQLPNGNEYEILDKDAALAKTPTDISATEETFVYQKSSGESCKYLTSIKGNSIVWNQNANGNAVEGIRGVTISNKGTNSFVATAPASSSEKAALQSNAFPLSGHVYYYAFDYKSNLPFTLQDMNSGGIVASATSTFSHYARIGTRASSSYSQMYWYLYRTTSETWNLEVRNYVIVDLTILGYPNITVSQLEARLDKIVTPPTPGILRNNSAIAIETTMFNQWDEVAENGFYNSNTGAKESASYAASHLRNKEPIPAFANTQYYIKVPSGLTAWAGCYAADGSFLGSVTITAGVFTTLAGTGYINFYVANYGITYNNNICINLSDPERNGTYEPHKTHIAKTGCDKIEVKSPNIWDEVWEGGRWDFTSNGQKIDYANGIRSVNYIPVIGGKSYYFKSNEKSYWLLWYDADKNFVSTSAAGATSPGTYTAPDNAVYMTFCIGSATTPCTSLPSGVICINLSGWANGRYFPHGILTFEDDMRSGGSKYNEKTKDKYYRRIENADLGDLTWTPDTSMGFTRFKSSALPRANTVEVSDYFAWCLSDKYAIAISAQGVEQENKTIKMFPGGLACLRDSAFDSYTGAQVKTALTGSKFNYALAVEEVYELANPTEMWVFADKDGTERIIYPESTTPYAPFRCDSFYATISAEAINDSLNLVEENLEKSTADINERIDELDSENPWEPGIGGGSARLKDGNSVASGNLSVAEGFMTTASGEYSHSEGRGNSATSEGSHAEGKGSFSAGIASHAEGTSTAASGSASHAEGNGTSAWSAASHAEGTSTQARASSSHAEGNASTALGFSSHAEGTGCISYGESSHTEGYYTQTRLDAPLGAHAEGKYNFSSEEIISSVGVGSSDSNRKNALSITENGIVYILGIGNYDGRYVSNSVDLATLLNPDEISTAEIERMFSDGSCPYTTLHCIAFDDYPEDSLQEIMESYGYDNFHDFIHYCVIPDVKEGDGSRCGTNVYTYSGEDLVYEGKSYQIWEDINTGITSTFGGALLDPDVTIEELWQNSLEVDESNHYTAFAAFFGTDTSFIYGHDLGDHDLVCITGE